MNALPYRKPYSFVVIALVCAAVLLGTASCANRTKDAHKESTGTTAPTDSTDTDVSDQMWSDSVSDAQLNVFQINGKTLEADSGSYYPVDVYTSTSLEDGHFYRVVADVEYLNGGVAGYVDFPKVKTVQSCEEISPNDLGLPSVQEHPFGLALIGDYADGDILLCDTSTMAVWKDGAWVYEYDEVLELLDGRRACVRKGVSKESVLKGIEDGVLSCADYFVLPASAKV